VFACAKDKQKDPPPAPPAPTQAADAALWKSVMEIHQLLEGAEGERSAGVRARFAAVIGQIMLIDLVFSFDSIITAVGMVPWIEVMIAAVIVSVGLMMAFAGPIGASSRRIRRSRCWRSRSSC
jgi:predicted tellurium resistance membrane protein TerC